MKTKFRLVTKLFTCGILLAVGAVQGCDCEEDLVEIPTPSCALDTVCKSTEAYRFGKCVSSYCDADVECCPGTFCLTSTHSCVDANLNAERECRNDRECFERFNDAAMVCTRKGNASTCQYQACDDGDRCPSGRGCFKGWCVTSAPCGGACAQGTVCDIASSTCHPVKDVKSCDRSCDIGQILVLNDPSVMHGDLCCPLECSCAALPAVLPGATGRFSSVGVSSTEVFVSTYDEAYGDLAVAHYSANGELQRFEYVDGVPATGTIGGDPAGPRRGIVTPGPDVGQYTSLALNAQGEPRVAYYDADNGDLRIALYSRVANAWSVHSVDSENDAGRYAALSIEPQSGIMRIAYMVNGLSNSQATELRVATSSVAEPASAQNWSKAVVERATAPQACSGVCQGGEACVLVQGVETCRPVSSICQPGCTSAQRCVTVDSEAKCQAHMPLSLADLPLGVGLFAALTHTPSGAVVVYYDAIHGDLKGAKITSAGPQTPVVLDGDGLDGRHSGDVGRFASIAYDPVSATLNVSYEDVTAHSLRLYRGVDLSGGAFEQIAVGRTSTPGVSFLGADSALVFDANGRASLVFQDASMMDLVYAERDASAGTWRSERLLSDGPFGFDTSIALTPTRVYITSASPRLDGRRILASRLVLYLRPF